MPILKLLWFAVNLGLPKISIFTRWSIRLKCLLVSALMNLTVLSYKRDVIRFLYVNLAATVFQSNSIETEEITQYTRMSRCFEDRTRWIWMRWRDACEIFFECKRLMIVSNKNWAPTTSAGAICHCVCWWQQQ